MIVEFIFFLLGAVFGSFANVIIVRLPGGESIVKPRSHCRSCKTQIQWRDNIPIISWMLLRGRCRNCSEKISSRYPLVELITACLFLAMYLAVGIQWRLIELLILAFGLVVVSFIDIDHFIIPDSFSLGGIALGFLGAVLIPERSVMDSFLGIVLGGGFLWLVGYLYLVFRKEEGMGGGDVKLLAWIGAVLGWKAIPFVILSSSLIASIVGIILALKTEKGLKAPIPYGPYLAFGTVLYICGGYQVALWYLRLFMPWLESIDI